MLIFLCAGTHSTLLKEDKQAADDSVYHGHEANQSNGDGAAPNPQQQQQKHGKECNHLNYEIPSTQRLCTKVIYFLNFFYLIVNLSQVLDVPKRCHGLLSEIY
jgi:hypothetical protein